MYLPALHETETLYLPYPSRIAEKYGFVRRTRLCYLYTQSGKRLTDMYQEAGRAILGWKSGTACTIFKNIMNRGATGSFHSEEEHRLEKAVQKLFASDADKSVFQLIRWYVGGKAAMLFSAALGGSVPLWRPWLESAERADALIFFPPFPFARDCVIFAAKTEDTAAEYAQNFAGTPSSLLPPCTLSGITRGIYDLIRELPARSESGWSRYDAVLNKYWERRGPYLFPRVPKESYARFAEHCLECGLVVSPQYDIPSIVPWGANEGDFTALNRSCPDEATPAQNSEAE